MRRIRPHLTNAVPAAVFLLGASCGSDAQPARDPVPGGIGNTPRPPLVDVEVEVDGIPVIQASQEARGPHRVLSSAGDGCLEDQVIHLAKPEGAVVLRQPFPYPWSSGAQVVLNDLDDLMYDDWNPPSWQDPATGAWWGLFGGTATLVHFDEERIEVAIDASEQCLVPAPPHLVTTSSWRNVVSSCTPAADVAITIWVDPDLAWLEASSCTDGSVGNHALPDGTVLCSAFNGNLYNCEEGERTTDLQ